MVKLVAPIIAATWMGVAWGLGLGSLEVQSNLDQPLDGVIELSLAEGDDLNSIEARIASREEFEGLNIDYPSYLGSVRLAVEERAGVPVLRILSDSIINEPFVHLLVRVDWSGGSFLREYTALIDPPIYAADAPPAISQPRIVETEQAPSYSNEDAQRLEPLAEVDSDTFADITGSGTDIPAEIPDDFTQSDDYVSFEDVQATNESAPAISQDTSSQGLDAQYGPVVAGESLSVIAAELQQQFPDLSIYQIMKVMFEENQSAFIKGNINGLMQGAILKIGDINAIRAVELADAREFYRNQLQDWDPSYLLVDSSTGDAATDTAGVRVGQDDYAFGDELAADGYQSDGNSGAGDVAGDTFRVGAASEAETFVSSSQSDSREGEVIALRDQITQLEASLASSSQENQELSERISILEGQLSDLNRLMTLGVEDADLANLEASLAAQNDRSQSAAVDLEGLGEVDGEADAELGVESAGVDDPLDAAADINDAIDIIDLDAQDEDLGVTEDLSDESIDAASGEGESTAVTESSTTNSQPRPIKVKGSEGFISSTLNTMQESGLSTIIAGVGAILLAGLALLVYRRRRADEEFEVSMLSIETNSITQADADDGRDSDFEVTVSEEANRADKETSFLTVYSDSDAVVQADEVDPIAEADVYIAYGRDEQAEEVLLDGIAISPNRVDIKQKLLSLYHKTGNAQGFERIAEELYAQRDTVSDADWGNVVAMGREISPENPLFDDAIASAGASLASKVSPATNVGRVNNQRGANTPMRGGAAERSAVQSKAGLINFDDVHSELSELDEVALDALDVSSGGASQRGSKPAVQNTAQDDDEIDLLYDLDEELTLTADEISYDIDDMDVAGDSPTGQSADRSRDNSDRGDTEQKMSDLEVASSYDEARTQYELAKVFVDLGDEDGAKKILRELAKAEDIDDDVLADAIALLDSIDS